MSASKLMIIAFALLASSCSASAAGHPQIVIDQTACSHCGMLVSEPAFAAAYRVTGHEARVFDDIGCMLEAIRTEKDFPINVWVQDAAGGGWIDADRAAFVTASRVRTPMNGGVLAYASASAAAHTATTHGGAVLQSFRQLTIRKGDAK